MKSQSVTEGSQGRSLEAGANTETEGNTAYWFALSGLLSYISFTAQAYQPTRDGAAHSGLGPSISTSDQENAPTDML